MLTVRFVWKRKRTEPNQFKKSKHFNKYSQKDFQNLLKAPNVRHWKQYLIIAWAELPNELKLVDVTLIFRKVDPSRAKNHSLLVFYPVSQKSLKESYTGKWVHMSIRFYHLISAGIEKALKHNKYCCHK